MPTIANEIKNLTRIDIGNLAIFFSYGEMVAFQTPDNALAVIENQWGSTTGKHLNMIDGGGDRLSPEQFKQQWDRIQSAINSVV